jgi:predicted metal-binding transcription factor (methanogenesis marker protein 9)
MRATAIAMALSIVSLSIGATPDYVPLQEGNQTCFGSLAWCCKTSSPCMFRDMTLKQVGLSKKEYMRLKRDLSDTIMSRVFHDVPSDESS